MPSQTPLQTAIDLHRAGRLAEAESLYRQILSQNPSDAVATNLLGMIAGQTNKYQAAIDLFRRATQLNPAYAEAHYNLAIALKAQGDTQGAIESFQRTSELNPNLVPALYNLAATLKSAGRLDEALEAYERAVHLDPNRAEAHYNIANVYQLKGLFDEAVASYQRALQINPNYGPAHNNLGPVYAAQGRLDDAIAECRAAIQLDPNDSDGYTNLLYALYHHPDYDAHRLLQETQNWAQRQPAPSLARQSTSSRRPKIGYLSAFFGLCPDAHYILPLLANHDRHQFEVFCYSKTIREDDVTQRMRPHVDHWFDIRDFTPAASVDLIRSHQLDILIVMARPADQCLTVAAHKLAPIQIAWLTFSSCTTGLLAFDYRISDPHIDPPDSAASVYSEKTLHLPETAWCYDPILDSPQIGSLPALSSGHITFGSLNRFTKTNPQVVAAWSQILQAVPGSHLHILAGHGSHRDRLLNQFRNHSIDPARIEFIDLRQRYEYLDQYNRIDITLDTFPFSGHTTALDSLWMGVPVVTLAGQICVGRAGASALHNLNLQNLIAKTPQDYVAIAIELSKDKNALAQLRTTLHDRMKQSPLTDGARFTRNIEQLYRSLLPT